jgi:hypothetical protein
LVLKCVTTPVIAFSTLLMSFSSYAGTITETTAGSDYTSDSSQKVTSSPFVRFIAFSQSNNGDASNSADFALTLDAEDLVYFSEFKQDTIANTGYVALAADGPILFPVATFQMCVESNVKDLTSSNYLKASVTNNQLSGGTNTSSKINLYVMLVGNGSGTNSANVATKYCTFGTAASDIKRYANSTAVNNSTGVLATTTLSTTAASLMTNAWTTASGGVSLVASGGSQNHTEVPVTVGQTGDCKLLHYGVSSTNTNPSSAAVSDPDGTDYEVDISTFTANTCGSSNANAVTAYVYADIRDFQSVPADTYSGTIQVGFSYATS